VTKVGVTAAELTALDLLELHLRCLYTHDATGRIGSSREPDGRVAARFHFGRTQLGNLWRFREDLTEPEVRALARLAGREAPLAAGALAHGERPPAPQRVEPFRRALAGAPIEAEWAGPAYAFPEDMAAVVAASAESVTDGSEVVPVTRQDEELLEEHFALEIEQLDQRQPCFAILHERSAVALCCSARPLHSQTGSFESCEAAEASVFTVARHRGNGHAPRVTAAWASAVAASGGRPLYSTSWQNHASRGVARKLGLACYAEDLHLT
jgi:hypothetical protein